MNIRETFEQEEEQYWNQLTKDEQLLAFCAVVRRICKGDLVERGTYRHVLYDTFGFGPDSYMRAQLAGYLELHNVLYLYGDELDQDEAT